MQAKMSAFRFIMVIAVEYTSYYNYIGSRASVCYRSNTVSAPLFEYRKAPPLRPKVLRRTVRRGVLPSTEMKSVQDPPCPYTHHRNSHA
jgi:hypothetical protein